MNKLGVVTLCVLFVGVNYHLGTGRAGAGERSSIAALKPLPTRTTQPQGINCRMFASTSHK